MLNHYSKIMDMVYSIHRQQMRNNLLKRFLIDIISLIINHEESSIVFIPLLRKEIKNLVLVIIYTKGCKLPTNVLGNL